MKKLFILIAVSLMFCGCVENDQLLEQRCEELRQEIEALNEEKIYLQNEVINTKVEKGIEKYVVTFCVKQTHFTLDIGEHIKDAMNEITFEVAVDKDYYDAVSIGQTINDDFRFGSLIMHGSFGNWSIKVSNKEIR